MHLTIRCSRRRPRRFAPRAPRLNSIVRASMRIASVIFATTGVCGLIWVLQQFLAAGSQRGAAFAILVPIALLFQAWQLWANQPNARKSAIATAVVLVVACAAELLLITWYANFPGSIAVSSPLQATLVSLWSGIVLYGAAAISLILKPTGER